MKEKCKSLFETNGIFYDLLKNGNTQGEICKILNIKKTVTAHKSQGQTLNKVSIDIGCSAIAHGAFYVALSRVRRFEDVLFFGAKKMARKWYIFSY